MFKTFWIETPKVNKQDHLVDGDQLAEETTAKLNQIEAQGYALVSITPVLNGRYQVYQFDGRTTPGVFSSPTICPDTCASFGYSMTDGLLVVARKQ